MNTKNLKVMKTLASGGNGSIYLAVDDNNKKYAVKALKKDDINTKILSIRNERMAGERLKHDHIIHYEGSAETDDFFFIVLEYIEGCDLFSYLEQENQSKPISEDIVKYLMIQLLDAVDYAHTNGIFHMDIKLDNIMIRPSDKFIKLIDFGLCDFIIGDDDKTSRRVGSEEYCPPEIIDGMYSEFSGRKVDIWCLGVVMYALLCARFPFSIKERRRSISLNKKHPSLTFPSFVTQDAKDVIRKMLSLNPKDRPSIKEIKDHQWFKMG